MATHIAPLIAQAAKHQAAHEFVAAETIYSRIIRDHPTAADAYHRLGLLLHQTNRTSEAIALMRKAIELGPRVPQFHANYSVMLQSIGMTDESIKHAQIALKLQPNYALMHYTLGLALRDLGQLDASIASFHRAIELAPNLTPPYENLGITLLPLGRFDEALAAFERAEQLGPSDPSALINLGSAVLKLGEVERAIELFSRAESVDPNAHRAGSNRLIALNYQSNIAQNDLFAAHVDWARRYAEPLRDANPPHQVDRDPNRRLRLGFVSPDFRHHAVATFLLPLLQLLDHEQFEIACYSDVALPDAMTGKFQSLAHRWRDSRRAPDAALEQMIHADQIDVLFDLAGHTADNRLMLFARKPAPIQINYLGWQNTTGLDAIDYRITDEQTDPAGLTEQFHSEKLVRLPGPFAVYSPPESAPDVSASPARSNGFVTFGSFAKLDKITPATFENWANVLSRLSGSRLIMHAVGLHSLRARDCLHGYFNRAGITADRVELRGGVGFDAYLAAHSQVDLLLDTFPFNNHTTTCHALWMGVPTLTRMGDRFASRMGLSVMMNIDLPELVAQSEEDFINRAVALASDIPALAEMRGGLRERMRASRLMNAGNFAGNFAAGVRSVWREYCG